MKEFGPLQWPSLPSATISECSYEEKHPAFLPPWVPMSLSGRSRHQRSLSAPLPSTHPAHWIGSGSTQVVSSLCLSHIYAPPLLPSTPHFNIDLRHSNFEYIFLKCTKKRSSFYFNIWMNTPGASLLFLWHYELFSFSGYILFPLCSILVPKFPPVHFFSSFTISYINSVKLPLHFKVDILGNFTFVQLLQPQESLPKPAPAPAIIPSYETQS